MNIEETKQLLTFIAAGDHRRLSEADLILWVDELPDSILLPDALEAVRMFRARPETEMARFTYLDLPTFRVYLRKIHERRAVAARRTEAEKALPPGSLPAPRGARSRDPEWWDYLYNKGAVEGHAERQRQAALNRGEPAADAQKIYRAAYAAKAQELGFDENAAPNYQGPGGLR